MCDRVSTVRNDASKKDSAEKVKQAGVSGSSSKTRRISSSKLGSGSLMSFTFIL